MSVFLVFELWLDSHKLEFVFRHQDDCSLSRASDLNAVTWDILHNCPYNQAWFAETLNIKGQGCSPLMIVTWFWTWNLRKDSKILVFISPNNQLQLKNELAHKSLRSKVSANMCFWPLDRKYSQSTISIFQTNQRRCTLIIKNNICNI